MADSGTKALFQALKETTVKLTKINLSENKITDDAGMSIVEYFYDEPSRS